MSTHIRGLLRMVQARASQSFDFIVDTWNRFPDEQVPTSPDTVVLAIFASAGGLSIVAALMLIAAVPR